MLRIGYVRLHDAGADDTAVLKALGCHVVRPEEPQGDTHVLDSILDFIGPGDELVVSRMEHLGATPQAMLDVVQRLEARDAGLYVIEPELSNHGPAGAALKAVLEAVARLEPTAPRRRRPGTAEEMHDLHRAGIGPVEIARRLGVSRMTVWRKLRAATA